MGEAGGTYPAVYNAANEECVAAFHAGRIGFTDIVDSVSAVVHRHAEGNSVAGSSVDLTVDDVLAADAWARKAACAMMAP